MATRLTIQEWIGNRLANGEALNFAGMWRFVCNAMSPAIFRRMLPLSAFVIAAMEPAVAVEHSWMNDSVGNSIFTTYDWTGTANWKDGLAPSDLPTDDISFTNCTDGTRYIALPDSVKFYNMRFGDSSRTVLVGKDLMGFNMRAASSSASVTSRIYADIIMPTGQSGEPGNGVQFGTVEICGDIVRPENRSSSVWNSVGQSWFRYDLYANAAGETRTDPGSTYQYIISWGAFHFVAPYGSDSDIVATWTLTEGSKYAVRATGQAAHVLCAGTTVTATGALDSGTFLKRIFDDGTIELSTAAKTSGDVSLTFGAFSPKLSQTVNYLTSNADIEHPLDISKQRSKDDYRFTVGNFNFAAKAGDATGESRSLKLTASTGIPGTFIVKDSSGFCTALVLDKAHVEIAQSGKTGVAPGFAYAQTVRMNGSSSTARVTVPNGIDGTFSGFSRIDGTFVKDGAGALTVVLKDSYNGSSLLNSGSITIEEGTMKFVAPESGRAAVANLEIAAGATLELDGDLAVTGTITVGAGSTLKGSGRLLLSFSHGDLSGLKVEGDAILAVAAQTATGTPIYAPPSPSVPGNPALWVDSSQGLVFASGDVSTPGSTISRWNDRRGTGVGYMFATNVASVYPTIQTNTFGKPYVDIAHATATKDEIYKTAALVWNVPLSNIRHVFLVQEVSNAGGMILGSSQRISTHDFNRKVSDQATAYNRILSNNAGECVRNADAWFNGIPFTTYNWETAFPYVGTATVSKPILVEFRMSSDAEADCFGFGNLEDNNNGYKQIYECIVYTNDLTEAERLDVVEYLMYGQMRAHANYGHLDKLGNRVAVLDASQHRGYAVENGDISAADTISGTGTFEKSGAGELYLDDCVATNLDVKVREGTLSVRSVKAEADNLPVLPVIHLDASDDSTTDAEANGGNAITQIADRRGAGYPVAVCRKAGTLPLAATAGVGGKTMIDFGDYEENYGQALQLKDGGTNARYVTMRTALAVIGTAKGGGFLAGDLSASRNYNQMGGLWRNASAYSNPVISSDISRPACVKATKTSAVRWRINGSDIANPTATGFSGGYDLVSMACIEDFGMDGLGACHYGKRTGGQEFGEELFFDETLSREQVLEIEAYLNEKWFGVQTAGYRGSALKSLDVASGATVAVCGNVPLKVSALSGAGTVGGAVEIAEGGNFVVHIAQDGSVSQLTIESLNLTGNVAVTFDGDGSRLGPGSYTLISSPSISVGDTCAWTSPRAGHRKTRLVAGDGVLTMHVLQKGVTIDFK